MSGCRRFHYKPYLHNLNEDTQHVPVKHAVYILSFTISRLFSEYLPHLNEWRMAVGGHLWLQRNVLPRQPIVSLLTSHRAKRSQNKCVNYFHYFGSSGHNWRGEDRLRVQSERGAALKVDARTRNSISSNPSTAISLLCVWTSAIFKKKPPKMEMRLKLIKSSCLSGESGEWMDKSRKRTEATG